MEDAPLANFRINIRDTRAPHSCYTPATNVTRATIPGLATFMVVAALEIRITT